MCPVCGKKVGVWHKDGVHPKCREFGRVLTPDVDSGIRGMSQKDRDAILRRVNAKG